MERITVHNHNLNGLWIHRESGSTLAISQEGDRLTGLWTAGQGHGHDSLRGKFNGHRCEQGFEGDYVNHEGVVTGVGRMRIEVLGHDQIRFFGSGDWSGGGAAGHVEGSYLLHRHG
jgi:hypothetical protein